jgi:UPF0716 protein FxsA
MRLLLVPLIFLGLPLAEIAGFVLVGRAIGLWPTLGLVVLTAITGILLLRNQGLHLLRQLSSEEREGRPAGETLVNGAMIVVAGILLLLPGFITDIIGLALFIPFVRRLLWSAIGRRIIVVGPGTRRPQHRGPSDRRPGDTRQGPVVDLGEDDFTREPNPTSPWSGPKQGPKLDKH